MPLTRKLDDWISSYLEYTESHEAPEKLHLWTAFSVLSASLRRRVWLDRGFYNLYPNLYIFIVAASAAVRKSVAMDIGVSMLQEAIPEIYIKKGRVSPEGLVKELNRVTIGKEGLVKNDSHVFIHADELGTLFGYDRIQASRMTILLTQLYGCPAVYPHTTAGEGCIEIHNACPSLLAGTDPANLKVLPPDAVGGLLGRVVFITEHRRRKKVAWPTRNPQQEVLRKKLIGDLALIGSSEGQIHPTQEAKDLFAKWYETMDITEDDPHIIAFKERCHDTALKIAMLVCVSRSTFPVLEATHVAAGIRIIEATLPETARVVKWTGASPYEQLKVRLLSWMGKVGTPVTRSQTLRFLSVPSVELDVLITTLIQEGTLSQKVIEGVTYYKLTAKKGEEYE